MREFERLPLRVHDFLAGVPLHDVWDIELPHTRPGITLDEFSRTARGGAHLFKDSVRSTVRDTPKDAFKDAPGGY
jgi:hypothetical protein